MLAILHFLWGIGKEQETAWGVLTSQFWPTDTTSSQHRADFRVTDYASIKRHSSL